MIILVDETNLFQAAIIHSLSWQDSHLSFCSPDFVKLHTPEHQQKYMEEKRKNGITEAARLYHRMGFRETGRINAITDELNEIELSPK